MKRPTEKESRHHTGIGVGGLVGLPESEEKERFGSAVPAKKKFQVPQIYSRNRIEQQILPIPSTSSQPTIHALFPFLYQSTALCL